MSQPTAMVEDSENKKRKANTEGAKSTITNHFPTVPKIPTSPLILKEGRYSNSK